MIYQIRANLYFLDYDAIVDIKDKILDHFPNATVIKPNSDSEEFSILEIIENHHDENPNSQCSLIFQMYNQPSPPD